jgi:large subunit ribosomal protein L10
MEHKPHISKKKERIIEDLVTLMKEYPVIGILDMSNLPALQFQRIKFKLKDKLEFRLVKKRLMKIAFDKSDKKDIAKLKDRLEGIPALIFSKEDPFKIAKAIKKEVSAAPARPGQIAPEDIILPAGPTPFTPGPMIGELGAMGIKPEVKNGKISIREDKVLVKKGEEINAKIADLLSKLGIEPMHIGFNLLLTYRDGEILEKDVLFVDEKLYLETLAQFARESEGLAIYIGYICKETVKKMLGKAENEAKALSDTVKLEEKMEIKEEVKVEEPKEEIKEEPQQEVVKEEPVEEVKTEEKVEEPVVEEPKEEIKEEPQQEVVKEEPEPIEEIKEEPKEEPKQEPVEQPEEKPVEEIKEEPEKIEETPKEEPKEEPVEEKKEVEKLKDVKEETMVGMRPGKDVTKEDIDLAAKQLQQIQDNLIKGGK